MILEAKLDFRMAFRDARRSRRYSLADDKMRKLPKANHLTVERPRSALGGQYLAKSHVFL